MFIHISKSCIFIHRVKLMKMGYFRNFTPCKSLDVGTAMPWTEVDWLYWIDYSVLPDTPPEPVLHDPDTGSENAISD